MSCRVKTDGRRVEGSRGVSNQSDEAELMIRCRAGDQTAFAEIIDRHKDPLVNYLTRIMGNREQGEDVAQETFLKFYQARHRYEERGTLTAYLFRIAVNLVRTQQRRKQRWRLLVPLLGSRNGDRAEPDQQRSVLETELQRQLAQALTDLPLFLREPLILHEIEGWTYSRIADTLDCKEGTVKSRIYRGRQRLKRQLEPYWKGHFDEQLAN